MTASFKCFVDGQGSDVPWINALPVFAAILWAQTRVNHRTGSDTWLPPFV